MAKPVRWQLALQLNVVLLSSHRIFHLLHPRSCSWQTFHPDHRKEGTAAAARRL